MRIAGDVVIELLTVIVVPIVRCVEQSTVVRIAKTFRKTNKINIKINIEDHLGYPPPRFV